MSGRTLSLRTKLTAIVLLGAVVPLAGLMVAAIRDVRDIRKEVLDGTRLTAVSLAAYSAADLAFHDRDEARKSLSALANVHTIEQAALYDMEGRLFAHYEAPGRSRLPPVRDVDPTSGERAELTTEYVEVRLPVTFEGARYGTLAIRSSAEPLRSRVHGYLLGLSAMAAIVLMAALLVAGLLRRVVSIPLLELTQLARRIAETEDYVVRAKRTGGDEIGLLGAAFNQMLEEIAARQEQAREAIRVRDEFLSVASHELKTPLTPLKLQVSMLQRIGTGTDGASPWSRILPVMSRQITKLEVLIGNLLDVSRIQSHRLSLEARPTDLAAVAKEVASQLESVAVWSGSTLEVIAEQSVIGLWDPMRIEQVVTNLVTNAIKYGEGQPIQIAVEATDQCARLSVSDRGIGISAEDVDRIFGRFERAVTARNYGGMGLGLYIAQQIVVNHGGAIVVTSQPGAGSIFIVELPKRAVPPDVHSGQ